MRPLFSIVFLITSIFSSGVTVASESPLLYKKGYTCPAAHSAYKMALADLKGLKGQLQELGCKSTVVEGELNTLVNLVASQRKNILKIISKNQGQKLSADEANLVQKYSSDVTESVAGLLSLLQTTNDRPGFFGSIINPEASCSLDEETRYAIVGRTASLVYEATKLISKVAGPYGVPIAIGGTVLSGFLQGMSQHMEGAAKIKFDDQDKRLFFAETLCLYHQYDNEIRQLLSPDAHLDGLKEVESFLIMKLEDLQENCEDCAEIIEDYDPTAEKTDALRLTSLQLLQNQVDPDQQETMEALDSLVWIGKEIQRFEDIAMFPSQGLQKGEIQSLRTLIRGFIEMAGGEFLRWFQKNELPLKAKRLKKTLKKFHPDIPIKKMKTYDMAHDIPIVKDAPGVRKLAVYMRNYELINKDPLFYNSVQWIYEDWKTLEFRIETFDEYCQFFANALIYSESIKDLCQQKTSGKLHQWKNYVAQASLHLSPYIENPNYPKTLGPHQLSSDFYGSYLNGIASLVNGEEPTKAFSHSFAASIRQPTPQFETWQEQLRYEVDAWKKAHNLQFKNGIDSTLGFPN